MVEISKLSKIIDGANRSISLSTNTIVVDNIKIKLGSSDFITFSGIITGARTITMPDNDVDLGQIQEDIQDLQDSIAGVQSLVPTKEKYLMSAQPSNLIYIDLQYEAIEETIEVSVDRLLLHEDDDYTVSIVEIVPTVFVTRITWAGDVAVGGDQALDTTDVIRVKYYYQG
jgi:hypothetical protein